MSRLRLKVVSAQNPTQKIRAIVLAAEHGGPLPGFGAGAHLRVYLPEGGERHYSLVNADPGLETEDGVETYRLGVLLEDGGRGGSHFMHGLRSGDVIETSEPINEFELGDHEAPAVLIAGGIGVTPLISMAAALRRRDRAFAFHYSGRSRPLLAFADEIEKACGDALAIYCDDEPERCLDIPALVGDLPEDAHVYVCGPRGMIEAVREGVLARGIAKEHIHFELFEQPAEQSGDTSFEVEVGSTGEVFTVPPGKSIIEVLEAGGVDLVYDCQRGDCGICQTAVLEGLPDHRDVILTEDERAAGDVMQICVSRARTPKLVLDL